MAKQTEGINGGFSGRVGTVVGYEWRGKWCMRTHPWHIKDARSERQLAQRRRFLAAVRLAAGPRGVLRGGLGYHSLQMHMTEGNLFSKLNKGCFGYGEGEAGIDYDGTCYIADGTVTLIQWPMAQGQIPAYNDCIEKYSDETEWLSFIDIDEFIYPNTTETVYEFLKPFQKNRPVVLAYWKCFGADGKIERDMNALVIEEFTKCREKYSTVSKIFYNTAYSFDKNDKHNKALHHSAWGKYKNTPLPPVNVYNKVCAFGRNPVPKKAIPARFPLQINHYVTKSYKEYVDKTSKGDVYFKTNPHGEAHFLRNERINYKSQDFQIWEYLIRLKLAMEKK